LNCIRCGRTDQIEEHHIVELRHGGSDEPSNKEFRCRACHQYEHTRRLILVALFHEKQRGQSDRIGLYQRRLEALDRLNTVELIRERGTYLSYWGDISLRRPPRPIRTKQEEELKNQLEMVVSEAMSRKQEDERR